MLGPFIDSLLICSITGLVIVSTGVWHEKEEKVVLVNVQADISVVSKDTQMITDSVIDGKVLHNTQFEVIDGKTVEVDFIRNHSKVDNAVILVNDKPYTGTINIDKSGIINMGGEGKVYLKGKMLQNGSPLTAWAFQTGLSPLCNWGGYIITIAVFLFAISTAISWSYYGDRGVEYLFGSKGIFIYKWLYVIAHFIGAIVSVEIVWSFGDVANGLMAIPNLIALIVLSGIVVKMANEYTSREHLTYKQRLKSKK
jgi:AGCS family alanine or glycine:cation symporter